MEVPPGAVTKVTAEDHEPLASVELDRTSSAASVADGFRGSVQVRWVPPTQ
ncbi:MAG: hypothetical protein ACI9NC_005310 [Verrucomicrobiales bacterium]|jgi:hypothetical protein